MATLVVFKFPSAEGANTMLNTLEGLQKQLNPAHLPHVHRAAVQSQTAGFQRGNAAAQILHNNPEGLQKRLQGIT